MSHSTVIHRLMEALQVKTHAALADHLGVHAQNVSQAKRTGVPELWLYKTARASGRSLEWLRTGKGNPWYDDVVAERVEEYARSILNIDEDVADAWKELDQDERATLKRCAELLRTGDREIRHHLIGQLKLLEDTARLRKARRPKRSHHGEEGGAAAG